MTMTVIVSDSRVKVCQVCIQSCHDLRSQENKLLFGAFIQCLTILRLKTRIMKLRLSGILQRKYKFGTDLAMAVSGTDEVIHILYYTQNTTPLDQYILNNTHLCKHYQRRKQDRYH